MFANAFTFIYSIRRGTPAARWEQVPREIALERFGRLLDAQNTVTRAYHERFAGTAVRALICGDSKKDARKLSAKSPHNVTVIAEKPRDYDELGVCGDAVARYRGRTRARVGLHRPYCRARGRASTGRRNP